MRWFVEHSLSIHSKAITETCGVVFLELFEVFLCLDSSQKSRAELYLFSFQLCQELTAMINEGEEDFNKQGRHAVQLVASCMLVCRGFVFQTKLRAVFWNQWPSLHTRLAFELEIFWIKPVLVKASAGFDLLAISRSKSWTHFYTVTPSPRLFQFHRFTVVKGFSWANTQRQTWHNTIIRRQLRSWCQDTD